MKESQKRIKLFRDSLPVSKQKIFATLLLLIMSAAILTTYTYAWFTMSRAPEVSKISTSISANGNLEIALCNDKADVPGASQIGDSVAIDGNLVRANTSWGNVINLYDEHYGLSNITLRPAQLNTAGLNTSPLWGAKYGEDGRIETLDSNYTFFTWDNGTFIHSGNYGVRAIGTYTTGTSGSTDMEYDRLKQTFIEKHNQINSRYTAVMDSDEYGLLKLTQGVLLDIAKDSANLLSKRVSGSTGETSTPIARSKIEDLKNFYQKIEEIMENEHKEQLVALANFQRFVYVKNSGDPSLVYQELTWDDIYTNRNQYNTNDPTKPSSDKNISLPYLNQFITDLNQTKSDVAKIEEYLSDPDAVFYFNKRRVKDSSTLENLPLAEHEYDLEPFAVRLLNYNAAKLHDKKGRQSDTTLGSVVSSGSIANSWRNVTDATLTFVNSILERFEIYAIDSARLNGTKNPKERFFIQLSVRVSFITANINMNCDLFTDANTKSESSYIQTAFGAAAAKKLVGNEAIAQDIYGLAIDFWLRSNASSNVLLAGATALDSNGNVMRYDGVNRIWNRIEDSALTSNSTTQGGGSCYVYYADTPEDMHRSLDLLTAMKVAFVDAGGNLVASAYMDTDHYWAQNGKITVPFVIANNAEKLLTLTSGTASRLTALIYMDGVLLTNDDVLAVNTIQGLLNLQFRSDQDLDALDNEELYYNEHSVSAEVSRTEMDFSLEPGTDLSTTITVKVEGEDPKNVEAFFLRAINSSQGSREQTMTFTYDEGANVWKTTYTFRSPGTFWLRSVRLDGVDYSLTEPQTVRVRGYGISDVTWSEPANKTVHYLTEASYTVKVGIRLDAGDKNILPKGLSAVFLNENGNSTTSKLTYNGVTDTWEGNVIFYSSGTYTLQYALSDKGQYLDVASYNEAYAKQLTLYMNMYAVVSHTAGTMEDEYVDKDITFFKGVTVQFFDGNHNSCTPGVTIAENGNFVVDSTVKLVLYYKIQGSNYYVDTDLTWNGDLIGYTGRLGLSKAGRYSFDRIVLSGQSNPISKASASPTYRVTPPGGVSLERSQSTFNTKTQVALNKRAYLGPINIKNSETARVSFTVKNAAGESYEIEYDPSETNPTPPYVRQGEVVNNVVSWYVYLPPEGLDGKWTIEEIKLWDCNFDGKYYPDDGSEKVVWTKQDNAAKYALLSSYVTTSVDVKFHQGAATVGSSSIPFYTEQKLIDTDTYVTLEYKNEDGSIGYYTDVNGNPGLTVTLTYTNPTDTAYGYALKANPHAKTTVALDSCTADGKWTVATPYREWAVGEYVATLSLGKDIPNDSYGDITYIQSARAVDCTYKLYSSAPKASDISFKRASTTQSQLKYSNDNFLTKFSPNVTVTMNIMLKKADGTLTDYPTNYVDYPEGTSTPSAKIVLTYQGEVPASYGLQGTNPYEKGIEFSLTANGNTLENKTSKTLLPGTYSVKVIVGTETTDGKDVTVLNSKLPSFGLAVEDIAKNENRYRGTGTGVYNNAQLESVKDSLSADKKTATLHFNAAKSDNFIDYTAPRINLVADNLGDGCINKQASSTDINAATFGAFVTVGTVSNNKTANALPQYATKIIDTFTLRDSNGATYVFNDTLTVNMSQPEESTWVNFSIANDSCSEGTSKFGITLGGSTSRTTTKITYTDKNGKANQTLQLTSDEKTIKTAQVKKGTNVTVSLSLSDATLNGTTVYTFNTASNGGTSKSNGTGTSHTISNVQANTLFYSTDESSGCIVEGTLVTLADGSKKKVEDLTLNDELLVFNHETGRYDFAKIALPVGHGFADYEITHLIFSDNSSISIVEDHAFFDMDLLRYVYLNANNYTQYIGHRFYKGYYDGTNYSSEIVRLTSGYVTTEYLAVYGFVTEQHLNSFTNDFLSLPGNIKGLFNIFEFDEDLKYDHDLMQKDIETYGLLTYEFFEPYLSYETYLKYPAKYFKISIGKGLMTEEDLIYLVTHYVKPFESYIDNISANDANIWSDIYGDYKSNKQN